MQIIFPFLIVLLKDQFHFLLELRLPKFGSFNGNIFDSFVKKILTTFRSKIQITKAEILIESACFLLKANSTTETRPEVGDGR